MKKVITILGSLGFAILTAYLSIILYTHSKLNHMKEKVIENYPEIAKVEKINSMGGWGEWFSEYVLVVEIDELKYRIWVSEKGDITDKMPL